MNNNDRKYGGQYLVVADGQVVESANDKAENEKLRAEIDLLLKKIDHGCANHTCPDCDT